MFPYIIRLHHKCIEPVKHLLTLTACLVLLVTFRPGLTLGLGYNFPLLIGIFTIFSTSWCGAVRTRTTALYICRPIPAISLVTTNISMKTKHRGCLDVIAPINMFSINKNTSQNVCRVSLCLLKLFYCFRLSLQNKIKWEILKKKPNKVFAINEFWW